MDVSFTHIPQWLKLSEQGISYFEYRIVKSVTRYIE